MDPSRVAHVFLALLEAVHRAQRGEPRLLPREAGGDAFLDLVFEMQAKLLGHFVLDLRAPENRLEAQRDGVEQTLDVHDPWTSES